MFRQPSIAKTVLKIEKINIFLANVHQIKCFIEAEGNTLQELTLRRG